MHHPPDLSLASSYIPACLCLFKCTIAFVLFIFSPVRGWIGLCSVLLTDRILWNQSTNSSTILDVNAVCVALVGGLMVMHARADGLKTLVHFGITGAWILLSSLQVLGAMRLHRAYEVLYAAFAVSALSCLFQTQERTELLALRSFVFVVANVTLPYLGVMLQQHEIDTYVNACRTLLILLGEPEIASAWTVVYILCIGYQIRGVSSGGGGRRQAMVKSSYNNHHQQYYYYPNHQSPYYDEEQPVPLHEDGDQCSSSSKQQSQPTPSSIIAISAAASGNTSISTSASLPAASVASEEAALLREALASRRGFRDA